MVLKLCQNSLSSESNFVLEKNTNSFVAPSKDWELRTVALPILKTVVFPIITSPFFLKEISFLISFPVHDYILFNIIYNFQIW